jgi:hypothetical protein
MSDDSCPPLYNAYEAKKLLDALHSKFVKKKTKMVYFPGRPAHTLTLFRGDLPTHAHSGLFSRVTCPHTLTVVYFHGRPAHTNSHWYIFMGDLPTHTHTSLGLFSWATYLSILKVVYFQRRPAHTLTLTLVYFHGQPAQVEKGRVVSL